MQRAGRRLQVPFGKPVVLLDQDQVEAAGRSLRVHVHGAARAIHSPEPLTAPTKSPGPYEASPEAGAPVEDSTAVPGPHDACPEAGQAHDGAAEGH